MSPESGLRFRDKDMLNKELPRESCFTRHALEDRQTARRPKAPGPKPHSKPGLPRQDEAFDRVLLPFRKPEITEHAIGKMGDLVRCQALFPDGPEESQGDIPGTKRLV
jgi:hypothetical protein